LASGRVVFQDFTRDDQDQRISLALLVPIREAANNQGLGLLVLGIDPATYLYPLINRWPAASRTAQTLLARRQGDQLQILNGQQFGQEPPISLHLSPGQTPIPSGQALLGRQGVVEGRDSRGVEVIADLRPVPDSPWFMVSLIDKAEVYAPLRERLWMMIAFVGAMLLGTAACVGYLWRQQRLRTYQEQLLAAATLRQKSAELERRNAEMERFTYTVSHDLKSPLVTIKTFLGYLEQDMAQADQGRIGQDLGYIRGAVDKMRQLLDELLEMSRVGRVVNPPVTTTFSEVVDEALRVVAGAISSRGVQVQVAPATVTLHGDRPRLVEVWQNLIENGVKYMGEQPQPRIEIGVRTEAGATAFYVRDNGMGIDPRHQRKVFGLFDKLNPQSEGSGLGLALVKRIVELYDGKIWLESEGNGQGTCFWFTLPQAEQNTQGVHP
jgi:signal transduction histidine kinase